MDGSENGSSPSSRNKYLKTFPTSSFLLCLWLEELQMVRKGLIMRNDIHLAALHQILCPGQHADLPSLGTDTANLHFLLRHSLILVTDYETRFH